MKKTPEHVLATNLAFELWRRQVARERWIQYLAAWLGCHTNRALALLQGATPSSDEIQRLVDVTDYPEEELRYVDFTQRVSILRENLCYLVDIPKKGVKKELSDSLDIQPATLSRWLAGKQRPAQKYREVIKAHFGVSTQIDLERDPLFLSIYPLHEAGQRTWLHDRINAMDAETLRELFPALEKLLRP